MRFGSWTILADESIGKVVIGILVFVVWGIGSLASMVKKANEQARRRAIAKPKGPIAPAVATDDRMTVGTFAVTGARRPPPMRTSMLQRSPAAVQKKQPARQPARIIAQPVRQAAPKPQAGASSRPVVEKVASIAQTNAAQTNLAGAKAPAIRRWLVPATLRKQFILTELLRPPMALRDEG
ncbi:MAG TPA: hypothetical protein VG326_17535 [Tepidisphaeraceae bacterium]|jgi:hypothetical protein|nr:hypothetical protein [Tepidisphaeraceae bacterium]